MYTIQVITLKKPGSTWASAEDAIAEVVAASSVNMAQVLAPYNDSGDVSTVFDLDGSDTIVFERTWTVEGWESFKAADISKTVEHKANLEAAGFEYSVTQDGEPVTSW